MSQWECPDGLMVDQWSRYSGCNDPAIQALNWYYSLAIPPLVIMWLYVALELYRHDPMRLYGA
jgi:hypothetical protein